MANFPRGDSQIEHGRASPREAIEMTLELVVEHDVARTNLVVPEVTGLLVGAVQHERRVGFGVEMTTQRGPADGLPSLAHRDHNPTSWSLAPPLRVARSAFA